MSTSSAAGCNLIVVSDTSPIRALHHLGLLPILGTIFGSVVVPRAVAEELAQPRPRFPAIRATDWPFVTVGDPHDQAQVAALEHELERGEAQAIVLAGELHADFLLIDELDGRRIAARRGLTTTGVLGVLVRAKTRGLVTAIGPLALRLRTELGFFLTDAVIAEARRLAGEP